MNKLFSTKSRVFLSLVGPSETRKSQLIYNWLRNGIFQAKFDKISFFYQQSQTLYDVMQEIEKFEFVHDVNFEFIDSLENNGTKYLIIGYSSEKIRNSKAFVDINTASRPRGLSTIYIKHNLFHQSKLGRNVELQNTQIVLSKSPLDVMQVSTPNEQLGLGSMLVDWYRDATCSLRSLTDWLVAMHRRPITFLYKHRIQSLKFYIQDRLKQSKILDDAHTNSLYSPSVPVFFPQMQKSLSSGLPKRFHLVSLPMHNKFARRKPAKHKKTAGGKIFERGSSIVSKTYNLEAKKRHSGVR